MNSESVFFKCLRCCTCGAGPKLLNWFYAKIKYERWSLSLQMVAGVFCSMVFVFAAVGYIMVVSIN